MQNKKLSVFIIALFLLVNLPIANVSAKESDQDMDVWLKEEMNPRIIKIVGNYNKSSQENWNVNLSQYLIEKDKKPAAKKLKAFRDELNDLKKEVKQIKIPDTADKKERKKIKQIKKNLTKTLKRSDKDANRLIKKFDKDKKVTSIAARKVEKKAISKASDAFVSLNEFNDMKVDPLKIGFAENIDQKEAEAILIQHDAEQKKIAEMKEKKKREKEEKKAAEAEKQLIEEEKNKAKREAAKKEAKEKIDKAVSELISMGDGSIKNIRPTSGDDWIAVYVEVDNTWHLFSQEEQKYMAETIGPAVESSIVETGITDYCDVHFIDENGMTVASPKFLGGGYKIKN
ncbi:hypothetical protein [Sporosarcina obsidiansis]|uniref:hypothetical protein n=1 Tax=Sporosarcina obsidiansis TaxID=2660748 RepID=UPI00129A3DEB|nr:hypothetical protein [Sporosarcina obsidiansis]